MPENSPQRSRWKPFFIGAGARWLSGFLVGPVAGAVIGIWAWIEFGGDEPAHPLADLDIPAGRMTIDETRPPIDRLARAYLSDANNIGLVVGVLKDGQQRVFSYGR